MASPGAADGESKSRLLVRLGGAIVLAVLALAWLRWPFDLVPAEAGPAGNAAIDLAVVALGLLWLRRSGALPSFEPPVEGLRRTRRRPAETMDAEDDEAWEPSWDPYRVLGVRPDATPEEITRAFREKMQMYAPDRVSGLDEEIQKLAHERVLEIRRAYEELSMPGARA